MTTSSASSQSHRSHEPKQDRSRATRDRILRSTISCLAESGWHGATMTLIAQEAGVSRGALQHHFPTREDLFLTAIDYMFEEREQAGLQAPRSQATPGMTSTISWRKSWNITLPTSLKPPCRSGASLRPNWPSKSVSGHWKINSHVASIQKRCGFSTPMSPMSVLVVSSRRRWTWLADSGWLIC